MNENCKLILGDCLEKMREMPDNSVDLVITDPPYNINYCSNSGSLKYKRRNLHNEEWDTFNKWKEFFEIIDKKMKENSHLYLFCSWKNYSEIFNIKKPKNVIVWIKGILGMGDLTSWGSSHEFVLFYEKGKRKIKRQQNWIKYEGITSFSETRNPTFAFEHPTTKPIGLMEIFINKSSKKNDVILDPFMGSGTTGVAALKLQRKFIGIEINKEYFEIAKKRIGEWQNQTRLF